MLRISLLGTPEIECRQDSSSPNILTKPKRFALLAYLASASPYGLHRRDTIIALLWPEFDQQRARAALSRTLYELRNELDKGTIITRGNEEIGIDWNKVWCDVAAFENEIQAGNLLGALDLYRGSFLRGFYLPGSPEFEHWQERQTTRLREMAVDAAIRLSQTMQDAPRWARRAREIDPHDERALQNMLVILDSVGDRAAALQEYDSFARRLAEEYDAEPAPETRRLIESIRSREIESASTPREDAGPGEESVHDDPVAETAAGTDDDLGGASEEVAPEEIAGEFGGRHRIITKPAVLALLVVALVVILLNKLPLPWQEGSPGSDRGEKVVVLPFDYQGTPAYSYLGEGLAMIISAELGRMAEVQGIEQRKVIHYTTQVDADTYGLLEGIELAGRIGADLFVLGEIVEEGGRIRLSASLHDRDGSRRSVRRIDIEGAPEEVFIMARKTVRGLFPEDSKLAVKEGDGREEDNRSLSALEAFITGDQAFRLGHFDEAQAHLKRALRADTTFARAALRLSQAANWTGNDWLARAAVETSIRHSAGLTDTERLFAVAWQAYLKGAGSEAERAFRALVGADSLYADAWFYLGKTLFHWGPTYGWSTTDAAKAFDRTLEIDPDNVAAIVHRGRLAAEQDDFDLLRSLTRRLEQIAPNSNSALELRTLLAWSLGNADEQRRILNELQLLPNSTIWQIAISVATHAGNPQGALDFHSLLGEVPDQSSVSFDGYIQANALAALLEAARGRYRAADAWIDSIAQVSPARALELRGILAIQPYQTIPYPRESLGREIAGLNGVEPPLAKAYKDFAIRPLLSGILALRSGDDQVHRSILESLERSVERDPRTEAYSHVMRAIAILQAEAARAAEDPRAALDAIMRFPITSDSSLPKYDVDFAEAHLRWLRAESYEAFSDDPTALRWYETFPDPAGNDLLYLAPSHLRRGRIYDRMGDAARAAWHYNEFISLWKEADPELRPLINEARLARARLLRSNAKGDRARSISKSRSPGS